MLQRLRIKNYALIQDLDVTWQNGFSTITGETGAGKSIMLGAIQLLMGQRADLSVLRNKDQKCVIEAEFNLENNRFKQFFQEAELDYDSQCIIRRELSPTGKSRSFVNDTPVTLNILKPIGQGLIDVHSQHQNMLLSQEDFQMQVLDEYANNEKARKDYSLAFADYSRCKKQLSKVREEESKFQGESDYKTFIHNELLEATLESKSELDELEDELKILASADDIQQLFTEVNQLSESEFGLEAQVNQLSSLTKQLLQKSDSFESFAQRAESLKIELQDLLSELQSKSDSIESDPARLEVVSERISLFNRLLTKHQKQSLEELIELRDQLAEELEFAFDAEHQIKKLEKELQALEEALSASAKALRKTRETAAIPLSGTILGLLNKLGMNQASLKISIEPTDFRSSGADEVRFLFSANKGMPQQELGKIASGGEMARIMLALKWVLCQHKQLPTIIFDEIDTGVSGEIASQMASLMQEMSEYTQVISITHLANIACRGKLQYKVEKNHDAELTETQMRLLSAEERIYELAEMMGGKDPGEQVLASAKALLNS